MKKVAVCYQFLLGSPAVVLVCMLWVIRFACDLEVLLVSSSGSVQGAS